VKRIAIIGAGPAGISLACFLQNSPFEVFLFEQNVDVGEKLKLTGGGRMNVSHRFLSHEHYFSFSPGVLKRIFQSFFFPRRFELFDFLGIQTVWEKDRLLLKLQNAPQEVARMKSDLLQQKNVQLLIQEKVVSLEKKGDLFFLKTFAGTRSRFWEFDFVVFASGGMFRMGESFYSAGDCYQLACSLGHSLTPVSSVLSPFFLRSNPFRSLSGISFPATLICPRSSRKISGDLLFTHAGISGPVVLDFSLFSSEDPFFIQFFSDFSEDAFLKIFQSRRTEKIFFRTFLRDYFPQRFVEWVFDQAKIPFEIRMNDFSSEQFKRIRMILFRYEISQYSLAPFAGSWTTKGGIVLSEIFPATLESRICSGAFFCGEILDVTGLCGGYNISFAIISARIVADKILSTSS